MSYFDWIIAFFIFGFLLGFCGTQLYEIALIVGGDF